MCEEHIDLTRAGKTPSPCSIEVAIWAIWAIWACCVLFAMWSAALVREAFSCKPTISPKGVSDKGLNAPLVILIITIASLAGMLLLILDPRNSFSGGIYNYLASYYQARALVEIVSSRGKRLLIRRPYNM